MYPLGLAARLQHNLSALFTVFCTGLEFGRLRDDFSIGVHTVHELIVRILTSPGHAAYSHAEFLAETYTEEIGTPLVTPLLRI